MRVISGTAKGYKLFAPKGTRVRPTSDRVKESLFNIIGGEVEGAAALDLFCGSGALGIEALSRGAAHATFVDSSPASIEAARRNLSKTGLTSLAKVRMAEVSTWLSRQTKTGEAYSLVFLDPPYSIEPHKLEKILEMLATSPIVAKKALIVIERASRSEGLSPKSLEQLDVRRYGDTTLWFFAPRGRNRATQGGR